MRQEITKFAKPALRSIPRHPFRWSLAFLFTLFVGDAIGRGIVEKAGPVTVLKQWWSVFSELTDKPLFEIAALIAVFWLIFSAVTKTIREDAEERNAIIREVKGVISKEEIVSEVKNVISVETQRTDLLLKYYAACENTKRLIELKERLCNSCARSEREFISGVQSLRRPAGYHVDNTVFEFHHAIDLSDKRRENLELQIRDKAKTVEIPEELRDKTPSRKDAYAKIIAQCEVIDGAIVQEVEQSKKNEKDLSEKVKSLFEERK